jgi:uncharacterized membrane protein
MPTRTSWSTILLAVFFVFAGAMHFVIPRSYERIVPAWLPNAAIVVAGLEGFAGREIGGDLRCGLG